MIATLVHLYVALGLAYTGVLFAVNARYVVGQRFGLVVAAAATSLVLWPLMAYGALRRAWED